MVIVTVGLLKCYFEDGVPLKIRSDEQGDDSIEHPKRRACLRGRAAIRDKLSPMSLLDWGCLHSPSLLRTC